MLGADVYPILLSKGIPHLYHANSVLTSNSLLQLGGLASRACVVSHGLKQTPQYTDSGDRRFGVWNDVFTDHVDIHVRASDRNKYGPVVFVLDARLLLELPKSVEVLITKSNPNKWNGGQTIQDRYFTTIPELAEGLVRGTFDQITTFRTDSGVIPFGTHLQQIILDDPQVGNVFASAQKMLQTTAEAHGVGVNVSRRICDYGCKCVKSYESNEAIVKSLF